MMALLMPASAKIWAKPSAAIAIAMRPKSLGESRRARTISWRNWTAATAMVDAVVHLAPEIASAFSDMPRTLAANAIANLCQDSAIEALIGPCNHLDVVFGLHFGSRPPTQIDTELRLIEAPVDAGR